MDKIYQTTSGNVKNYAENLQPIMLQQSWFNAPKPENQISRSAKRTIHLASHHMIVMKPLNALKITRKVSIQSVIMPCNKRVPQICQYTVQKGTIEKGILLEFEITPKTCNPSCLNDGCNAPKEENYISMHPPCTTTIIVMEP